MQSNNKKCSNKHLYKYYGIHNGPLFILSFLFCRCLRIKVGISRVREKNQTPVTIHKWLKWTGRKKKYYHFLPSLLSFDFFGRMLENWLCYVCRFVTVACVECWHLLRLVYSGNEIFKHLEYFIFSLGVFSRRRCHYQRRRQRWRRHCEKNGILLITWDVHLAEHNSHLPKEII